MFDGEIPHMDLYASFIVEQMDMFHLGVSTTLTDAALERLRSNKHITNQYRTVQPPTRTSAEVLAAILREFNLFVEYNYMYFERTKKVLCIRNCELGQGCNDVFTYGGLAGMYLK